MKDCLTIQYKSSTDCVVKDVDYSSRTVTGYYGAFGNIDSDRDMIMNGAFKQSINEMGVGGKDLIFHLHQHKPTEVIGKPNVLKEDNHGLYFETKLVDTMLGNDVLKLYREGIYKQHSIGFQYVKDKTRYDEKNDVHVITEVKLFEGSTVTWGSNQETPFTGFKGSKEESIEEIKNELKYIMKSLKVNGLSDEMYRQLEITQLRLLKTVEVFKNIESISLKESLTKGSQELDIDFLIKNI